MTVIQSKQLVGNNHGFIVKLNKTASDATERQPPTMNHSYFMIAVCLRLINLNVVGKVEAVANLQTGSSEYIGRGA